MASKTEGDGKHPSSHYLVVEDPQKPSTWHLRVRNASGKLDHTLMGAAWAALHGGYRGNKYAGPNKAEAIRKLTNLYKREGMPTPGGKSLLYKDKNGQSWFLGIYSNNFEDREREILTWESHKEYAQWVKQTGIKLPVTIAHQPKYPDEVHLAHFMGLATKQLTPQEFSDSYLKMYKPFAFAQTEAIIPLNGFTLVVAKILKGKEKVVELLNKANWGMSHGYLMLDRSEKTIDQYRSFEFTSLPMAMAANSLTVSSFSEIKTQMENIKGLDEKDRELLKEVLNADPDALEEATRAAQEVLQKVLASKEMDTEEEVTEDAEETEEGYDALREKLFADMALEELQSAFKTIATELQKFNGRLDDMEVRMKSTERSEDEKVAEKFAPPQWDFKAFEVEEEPENAEELREKALGDKPLDGLQDLSQGSDNPLKLGMWDLMGFRQ